MIKCKVCNNELLKDPLLSYKNMPKSAQFLPDESELSNENGIELDIFQCSGCGLVQLTSEPVHYYREVIRASGISEDMMSFRREQFSIFIEKFSLQGKKIIEIGCGKGEYLSIMNRLNVKASGLEYSDESIKHCSNNGLTVTKGYVVDRHSTLGDPPYDAFYMLNYLEHIPEPNELLRGVYNNLAEGAVGIIEVPNFDMILNKNLFSEFISDHLFYFTKSTLKTLLAISGFEIIECTDIWHNFIIQAIVRKKSSTIFSGFGKHQKKITNDILDYISCFKDGKVAIWGAGHQSLSLITLTGIADKIKYVVDSASFKQGKYTPATHLPIVAPQNLIDDPIDAIIIMAVEYSDEVADIIRTRYNSNDSVEIDIAILRDYGLERASSSFFKNNSNSSTHTVSVIVPCYNASKHISKCIESVLSQSARNIELILVDDCSKDNSHYICNNYFLSDGRIKLFSTPSNKGPAAARNLGLENATGSYVLFLDADDTLREDAISLLLENMEVHCVDLVSSNFNKNTTTGIITQLDDTTKFEGATKLFSKDEITEYSRNYLKNPGKYPIPAYCWGKLFKTAIIKANKLSFNEDMNHFEDVVFNFEYLKYTKAMYFINEPLYNYTVNTGYSSTGMEISYNILNNVNRLRSKANEYLLMSGKMGTFSVEKETSQAFIHLVIVHLVRSCGQLNHKNKKSLLELVNSIISDPNFRKCLNNYVPHPSNSTMILKLMKLKLSYLTMLYCRHMAVKRYGKAIW